MTHFFSVNKGGVEEGLCSINIAQSLYKKGYCVRMMGLTMSPGAPMLLFNQLL